MEIIPLGAAGTVTGSRFLVLGRRTRVLVDCGLFQGLKVLRSRNWEPFPTDPGELDAVVLTHAHLDHSGLLPVLVREGFRGPIHATAGTADLLTILLADAGRLQEEDAAFANRKGFSRHRPARPLFDQADAAAVEDRVETRTMGEEWEVGEFRFRFHPAGHLLGAAMVEVWDEGGDSALFSGDLGRADDLLYPPPAPRPATRRLVMECTYGDRSHPEEPAADAIRRIVGGTVAKGGVVMIPTFAVGRAQAMLLLLHRLEAQGAIPAVPTFLDSPMAIRATGVHRNHARELRPDPRELAAAMEHAQQVSSPEESRALNHRSGPMVILAGSGMLTGGRILHHLKAHGDDRRNVLVLVGYQAEGTRGRELRRGQRSIRVHGRWLPLACRVEALDVMSGHADREELLDWACNGEQPGGGVHLVHGEPGPADHLRKVLADRTGWSVTVAREGRPMDPEP